MTPVVRDPSRPPNTDQAWSRLQRSVNRGVPVAIRNTARSVNTIRNVRRGR